MNPPTRRRLILRAAWALAAIALAGVIYVQSSHTAVRIQDYPLSLVFGESQDQRHVDINELGHKVAHVGLYAGLAFCLHRALGQQRASGLAFAVGAAFLYGISDEWHQSLGSAREASVADALFDLVGAIVGSVASRVSARFVPW